MSFEIQTPFLHYTVHDEFILEAEYKKDIPLITKEMAESILEERLLFQGGRSYRLLMHGETKVSITAAAKSHLSGPKGLEGIAAVAVLFDNWTVYNVVRFIARFKKSIIPIAIFRDHQSAKEWLLEKDLGVSEPEVSHKSTGQQYADHLFDLNPTMQIILSENETIARVNEAVCLRLDYSEEELTGKPFAELTRGGSALCDSHGLPVPVRFDLSKLPSGLGGHRETLVTAWETSVPAIRDLVSKAATSNPDPESRPLLEAAVKALTPLVSEESVESAEVKLTAREREIVNCMSNGMTAREMADLFGKSPRTIDAQKRGIFKKLKAKNGVEMMKRVNELGLGK